MLNKRINLMILFQLKLDGCLNIVSILMMKLLKVSFSQHMNQTFESCSLQLVRREMNLTDLNGKSYKKGCPNKFQLFKWALVK